MAPDNRGNGRSEREPPNLALESYAEDTLRLCRALGLQRPDRHLTGHPRFCLVDEQHV